MNRIIVAIALCAASFAAFGHGGENHGAPPPPLVGQSIAPRAIAATEEFELVAVLEGRKLVLYLDRYASNEPVAKARVEVEGAGLKGVAGEAAPGTYVLDVAAEIPAGKHPLTIAVEIGEYTDLLSATLDTSHPAAAVHVHGWREQIVWIVAGLLLLAGAALLALRRRANGK